VSKNIAECFFVGQLFWLTLYIAIRQYGTKQYSKMWYAVKWFVTFMLYWEWHHGRPQAWARGGGTCSPWKCCKVFCALAVTVKSMPAWICAPWKKTGVHEWQSVSRSDPAALVGSLVDVFVWDCSCCLVDCAGSLRWKNQSRRQRTQLDGTIFSAHII